MHDNASSERALNRALTGAELGDLEWHQREHPLTDRLPDDAPIDLEHWRRLYGSQWLLRFPNGYGASVCNGEAITAGLAPYEVALIRYAHAESGADGAYEILRVSGRGDLTWVLAELTAISELTPGG